MGMGEMPYPAFDLRCPICHYTLAQVLSKGELLYLHVVGIDNIGKLCPNQGKTYRLKTQIRFEIVESPCPDPGDTKYNAIICITNLD